LTSPDTSRGELGHWWPQVLPGGEAVLYTAYTTPIEKARICVVSLETRDRQDLLESVTFARYMPTGHLAYVRIRTQTLMAVPFDLARLKVTGDPQPVLEDVSLDGTDWFSQFSASEDGSLVYVPASVVGGDRLLVWVDRSGKSQPVSQIRRRYADPKLSPDGRRLAVTILGGNQDIWVQELARGTLTRLTFGEGAEMSPRWTPDGRRLVFISEQPIFDLHWKSADGSAPEEALLASQNDKRPMSFSPDGRVLAYVEEHPDTLGDIWLLPLVGERKPQPFLRTRFVETLPAFSPDGRWLAYQSNESGRNEIYVQEYPGPGAKQQVSIEGGAEPVWARSGRELFYRDDNKMMAVEIRTSPAFQAAKPRQLFEGEYEHFKNYLGFDVTPDGQRFLMVKTPPESAPRQINVVLNWADELRRRVTTRSPN
jgi:serine/threonine-protein kinase